LIIWLRSG